MAESKYTIAAKKKWVGISVSERSRIMRERALDRWKNATIDERKKVGTMLRKSRKIKS